jgi:hypothetical protein
MCLALSKIMTNELEDTGSTLSHPRPSAANDTTYVDILLAGYQFADLPTCNVANKRCAWVKFDLGV